MNRLLTALAAVAIIEAAIVAGAPAVAASAPTFKPVTVGKFGGEPSIVFDHHGRLFDTTPQGGTITYRSGNRGKTWQQVTTADPNSGDDCLASDQSGAVYLCNLAGSEGAAPLQADVWKTIDHGQTWKHGEGPLPECATSCSEAGVDRDWLAASILDGSNDTSKAEVVLMYHDFYGPSQIWVNISKDGGKTFGQPQDVLTNPAITPGAITGTLVAQGYTFCNTIPAGVGIVPPGKPNAGRIIVGWIAADLAQNATGCNVSMAQAFHTAWISYSDDDGQTWTPQQAWDAGVGHDMSTPFVGLSFDRHGNPYYAVGVNANSNPATCSAESTAGTVQNDTSCEYDMYVVWSPDQGATWDGGGGTVPGSAAAAYRVNKPSETGTHFFPAIATEKPGEVDIAYLRTPEIVPTDSAGKADPGGCGGPGPANGNPTTYPPACSWNLYAAQSLNLTQGPSHATWKVTQVTTTPMHVGDICNLGIACVAPSSNRHLLDFITEAIDNNGCAYIAYADDNTFNKLRVARQTGGSCL